VTYEPGQQVLVRGVLEHQFADGLAYVRFSDSDDHMHAIEAADVVGPTPATPDRGPSYAYQLTDDEIDQIINERQEVRAALAAAEAERDATNALISSARISLDQVTAERDAYRATLASVQEWCAARRHNPYDYVRDTVHEITAVLDRHRHTLSVEATGTEGGGGHE
jgi:hypothetical protein